MKSFPVSNDIPFIASGSAANLVELFLNRTGLCKYFSKVFSCVDVGSGKDKPDVYLAALEHLGTPKDETWVFEDAVHGARTAFQAGYWVAGLADPYSDQAVLKTYCHLYLPDLTDFDGFWAQAVK